MGYYIRVLGLKDEPPSLDELCRAVAPAVIEDLAPSEDGWARLVLKHTSGEEIALIERDETVDGLGFDELAEFIDEVGQCEPLTAASWLQTYLPAVKTIYAFQVLSGTLVQDGWARLHAAQRFIWNHAGGILQADGEGFSNEDGYTILWQFGPNVSGSWKVAILNGDGVWMAFEMDLGDEIHRDAFKRGEVPAGVKASPTVA